MSFKGFAGLLLMVLSASSFIAGVVLHWGISKYERNHSHELNIGVKQKKRIALGFWCKAGFVPLAILGVLPMSV